MLFVQYPKMTSKLFTKALLSGTKAKVIAADALIVPIK